MRRAVLRALKDRAYAGRFGEAQAARFLKKEAGMRVLLRNWRKGHYELDLVCRDGPCLVFVEVRTRRADALVGGYHSLGAGKRDALRKACQAYLKALPERPTHMRLDAVEVALSDDGTFTVRHYLNLPLFRR